MAHDDDFLFVDAERKKQFARVAITGPTGSGKTLTALRVARGLAGPSGIIAVIDTERGSASKYAGITIDDVRITFKTIELKTFEPKNYIRALAAAAKIGARCVVTDSLSHAWFAEGGLLDQKDKKGGNSFDAWKTLTPQQNELIDAILSFPGHLIATMRSKMEYLVEKDGAKTKVTKVGLAPVQRDNMEYEFDIVGDMTIDHVMNITKSRCFALADQSFRKPTEDVGRTLLAWLDDGIDVVSPADALIAALDAATPDTFAGAKKAALAKYKSLSSADQQRVKTAATAAEKRAAAESRVTTENSQEVEAAE